MRADDAVARIIAKVQADTGCTCGKRGDPLILTVLDLDGTPLDRDDDVPSVSSVVVAWEHERGCPCRPPRFEAPV